MEVAKEKSRARHSWLYQAEEEFEKVPWCRVSGTHSGWGSPGQGPGPGVLPDPRSHHDAEAEG